MANQNPKTFGPRSKFSLLPHQIRWRAYTLLNDGATLKALLADAEIRDALARAGMTLSSANLTGIRKSREYAEFTRLRRKHLEAKQQDMMLTAIAQGTGTLESMTDQARVRLMEAMADLSDLAGLSEEERIRALRSLSQSVAALSNNARDEQIAGLRRKLDDSRRQLSAAETEWKAREAALLARIAELEKRLPGVDTSRVADEMDRKYGV